MSMFNEYQYEASRTFKPTKELTSEQVRLLDWSTGLGGEAGEVLDLVKHAVFHNETFDKMALAKELGDVLWYVSAIATTCDIDLGDVAALNRAKLDHRYLSGKYSEEESANRHSQENRFEDTAIYKCLKSRICRTDYIPFSIIVIGPDGAGKTTFTKALAEHIEWERIKCDFRQEDKPSLALHYLCNKTNVIYDRFYWPDEFVYSEVKHIQLPDEYLKKLHAVLPLLSAANVVVLYMDADMDTLSDRAEKWEDDYVAVEQLKEIRNVYQRYLGELTAAGVPVLPLTTEHTEPGTPAWNDLLNVTYKAAQSRAKCAARGQLTERRV